MTPDFPRVSLGVATGAALAADRDSWLQEFQCEDPPHASPGMSGPGRARGAVSESVAVAGCAIG